MAAGRGEREWAARLAAGLGAGLEFLAADPPLARLLLIESPAAPARLERERSLDRLARAMSRPAAGFTVADGTSRLLAGGLTSYLAGRVLAGEAARLRESHELLLQYLLRSSSLALRDGAERRVACV